MIKWTNTLVQDLARRKCILFLGSGVSMNSVGIDNIRPPSWKNFLEKSMRNLPNANQIKKLIRNEDYLTACELIKLNSSKGEFETLIKECFLTPKYKPAPIHECLFKLDSRIVITPNFDKIYDTYVTTETQGSVVIKNYFDLDIVTFVKDIGRLIIKIHGTADGYKKFNIF
ncbi:hypothetical protein [Xenorhabdus kozodoii]|uniref:SIR2-like domain-containing protein n=1 Tax=Xenorhabdus kozodoii TaxID=351676 RepID=A0A2D0LDA2_9GAMM|nr:hypothetical protein [Xenorhabdus kozodoii]PHM73575.1 hypothetical protein Xkoz_01716 [Xenorhabdus kozodoii]